MSELIIFDRLSFFLPSITHEHVIKVLEASWLHLLSHLHSRILQLGLAMRL